MNKQYNEIQIANIIESTYREIQNGLNLEFLDLYKDFNHDQLKNVFSTLHSHLVGSFEIMNQRLPTLTNESHFWAEPSRHLITTIERITILMEKLKNSEYSFRIENTYYEIIETCNQFLSPYRGSSIPVGMEKIELYYKIPIFIPNNTVLFENHNVTYNLKMIGHGSYANVYSYKDENYDKQFVIKRAKATLNDKELIRFKEEFNHLKNLSSPYLVEVYKYNDDRNEYSMEYLDYNLHEYINTYNNILNIKQRKRLCLQILRAFDYIHNKKLLHRDISPKNIFIKVYEFNTIIKVGDFGLVKNPDLEITSIDSEIKGYFNDPVLVTDGFNNYNLGHELFAITKLLYFVLTGRTNTSNIENHNLRSFVNRGLHPDSNKRFKTLRELKESFITKIYNVL